ncbi:hypothetical protein [Desulfurispira natronophila]|uniref:Uncharacterized protein n=1 Tax=Desulfurispira natronophila TaxID=682562 RepID=A0A7W7Y463_9BACT|nr:hypothetical protein [Desulfurispira natronophila]MBB5021771.1 hypothetical protein [Desulfurispira natronophila]
MTSRLTGTDAAIVATVTVLLLLCAGCARYAIPDSSAVQERCPQGIAVPALLNESRYHEQGPRIRDALIGELNRRPGLQYHGDSACELRCTLFDSSQQVTRRDAFGDSLSEDSQFRVYCELVKDGLIQIKSATVTFTDDTFVRVDARSRYENLAGSVVSNVTR